MVRKRVEIEEQQKIAVQRAHELEDIAEQKVQDAADAVAYYDNSMPRTPPRGSGEVAVSREMPRDDEVWNADYQE